jgi:hypothetical protein
VQRSLSILLLALSGSVILWPAKADTKKLASSPRPQLTGNTWRKLSFNIPAGKAVECTASISVKSGVVVLVTMSQSTGLKAADAEICDWIKRRWQFNPKLSGTFAMPLVLHPAEATVTTRG